MGLSKSKSKFSKGEEQEYTDSCSKCKSQVPKWIRPVYNILPKKWLDSSMKESLGVKRISSMTNGFIPQIIVTRPSTETLRSCNAIEEEQKTIRETAECSIYCRHRNPSTVDAYNLQDKE
ncbi:spermatogenesis-associated protein 33 isoform X2 [Erinaceus europaeus]|uniref:Spermatogenesis-associated protein 33 isoform X2 n=1 Tax=Erinaceus europaeus TaxID=9365 RepID=A0A1S3WLZ1_ERIEU|nr:spermatogenesis-associated protein 33 isoform X2 [Erinaceus europaeus]